MYQAHSSITTPPDDAIIWRYMNLEKLLTLLCTQSLFLCRLDQFVDPWEGSWPRPFVDDLRNAWAQKDHDSFFNMSRNLRQTFFVNCWHENKHESAALWDQYAKSSGFAIRSTVGRLKQSILDEGPNFIGNIEYLDYDKDNVVELNMLKPPFLKRKSFQHEKEVRLMIWEMPIQEDGPISWEQTQQSKTLRVDLSILIEEIYASPTLDDWLLPHIRELFSRFGFPSMEIKKSDLYAPHVY